MKSKERLELWKQQVEMQGHRRCDACGLMLVLYTTRYSKHKYWICSRCSDKFCYTYDGKKDFKHTKWCPDDFTI